jgi:hypothetical protein
MMRLALSHFSAALNPLECEDSLDLPVAPVQRIAMHLDAVKLLLRGPSLPGLKKMTRLWHALQWLLGTCNAFLVVPASEWPVSGPTEQDGPPGSPLSPVHKADMPASAPARAVAETGSEEEDTNSLIVQLAPCVRDALCRVGYV